MKPIYTPSGAAKEYGDLAINIYTGCPHKCFYCFAPNVLHRDRKEFHENVRPRTGIVDAVRAQLKRDSSIKDKLIHLCFVCDPYPEGYDTTPTREIIRLIKESGNHVQILTKGDGRRDFDLMDGNDWYGITLDGTEDNECFRRRLYAICMAHAAGINTWVSLEPVVNAEKVLDEVFIMQECGIDKVKIGKLNYFKSAIDWKAFGEEAERLCKHLGLNYYIKDSLRNIMNGGANNG